MFSYKRDRGLDFLHPLNKFLIDNFLNNMIDGPICIDMGFVFTFGHVGVNMTALESINYWSQCLNVLQLYMVCHGTPIW